MSTMTEREEYAPHIYRKFYKAGQVQVYEFETMIPEHVDRFFDRIIPLLEAWEANQPYLMVYDLSHLEVSFSPYFKKRVFACMPLLNERRLHGRRALVVRKNVVGRIISQFGGDVQKHTEGRIVAQTFFDQKAALAWVMEGLD